jgi:hypothetical protein
MASRRRFGILFLMWFFQRARHRAEQIVEQFRREANLRARERAPHPTRPPLFGEPLDGDAWAIYQNVLSGWRQVKGSRIILETSGPAYIGNDQVLPTLEPAFEQLRRAMRMRAIEPPADDLILSQAADSSRVLY